jgi:hypothetical protein
MNMIADSSESLPLDNIDESEEEVPAAGTTKPDSSHLAPPTTNGSSKLAEEPLNAGDIPTPTPDKPNPLEQVPTVRVDSSQQQKSKSGGGLGAVGVGGIEKSGIADFATPSPLRSHEVEGPELGTLGKRISRMISHSQTDLDGDKETTIGPTASRATTVSQTPSGMTGKKERPGMDKRSSTMKRISSAFKRTVSKNQ